MGGPRSAVATNAIAVDTASDQELAGLDALDLPLEPAQTKASRLWSSLWPKLVAIALAIGVWQTVVWSGWKPDYLLAPPGPVFQRLATDFAEGTLFKAIGITMARALFGYFVAVVVGVTIGLAVSRFHVLREGVGALITGLQTMPSIAWFPLAIMLFKLSESAIFFVVVLGAAPAIANGLINGIDHIPPVLLRAGRVLGAKGFAAYRHVILPAALPSFIGGMKQGWAFAWRSLMAGELLVIIAARPSIGVRMQFAREAQSSEKVIASMIVILIIGLVVDALFFAKLEKSIRTRWGFSSS